MKLDIIKKLRPLVDLDNIQDRKSIFMPVRYLIMHGGRGGGKSIFVADILALEGYLSPKRILCCREIQKSIADSVMQGLWDSIVKLGLDGFYKKTKSEIVGANGTRFMFYGLRTNITSIKSISGIDFVWCEEAENISKDSWSVLLPSIRADDSRIIITFNPKNILDETYVRFVLNPPTDSIVVKVNYNDNPFFPEVLENERLDCLSLYPDSYPHIWDGEPLADSEHAIIKPSWIQAAIDAHIVLGFKPEGIKVVGMDVADEGADSNAMTARHGSVVFDLEEWRKGDVIFSANKAFAYADLNGFDQLTYDSIGVGAGVKAETNRLMDQRGAGGKLQVSGFNAGGSVVNPENEYMVGKKNKDMFSNIKAQAWWQMRDRFSKTYKAVREGADYPPDELISLSSTLPHLEQLKAELSRPMVDYDNNGRAKVESKKDMAKRGIPSPNLADSLIMSFAPTEQSGGGILLPSRLRRG